VSDFDDLLEANRRYAQDFRYGGLDGVAGAGVAVVTCMDSRIDPLGMLGLHPGDAKVIRNPGGRVTSAALEGLILAANLLRAERILVIPHTRCAMGSATEKQLQERVGSASGHDATWQSFGVVANQEDALREDLAKVRTHPLIPDRVKVAGFIYDVDTGLLDPLR
jgi:carbonic anhydrase